MKRYLRLLLIVIGMAVGTHTAIAESPKSAPPKPAARPAAQDRQEATALSGKVVETMDAGGYTYVCIEKAGRKTWVAVPQMKVAVGRNIRLAPGMEMANFSSKTLNRTFDKIVFSPGLADAPAGAKDAGSGIASPASKGAVVAPAETVSVEKAAGPNACTVAEAYANKSRLNSKTVLVRGKVVKVSAGIMGKNWIHLQDGSGDPAQGTHDLVVTSQDLPNKGDVVTMSGTLYQDKDFGSGYKYAVLVEQATIVKK